MVGETAGVDEINRAESLQFDFNTIRVATDNFSDANKLGQGGFGAVYKVITICTWEVTYGFVKLLSKTVRVRVRVWVCVRARV